MKILQGDAFSVLKTLENESIDCIITSPPYWGLRDYGIEGQLGSERSFKEYADTLLNITAECQRVLKKAGTLWWNHGDSYAHKTPMGRQGKNGERADRRLTPHSIGGTTEFPDKSLTLQAHRLAIRMVDEQGWILRNQIIWHKPNVMPASVKDRFTVDFEPVFFFTKSKTYHFEPQYEPLSQVSIDRVKYGWKSKKANASAKGNTVGIDVEEMGTRFANPRGRNKRTVWKIPTSGSRFAHVAMFPPALIEPMILAGCPLGGVLLDPFMGSGTTLAVAAKLGREGIGIELNPEYIEIAKRRLAGVQIPLQASSN